MTLAEGIDSPYPVTTVAVLGAGTMGHGIAQICAMSGFRTALYDPDETALQKGLSAVTTNLAKGVSKGKVTTEAQQLCLEGLRTTSDFADCIRDAQLVIEAAPERLELKKSIVQSVFETMDEPPVFATNTSSLSVTEIAAAASHPEMVCGMHFFNPVHIMKLLEVVRAEQTSTRTLATVRSVGERLQRELIVVNDSAGFATSRLGLILGLEAMRMVESGVASPREIDTAMELGYRHPMGPLKLTDLVGLDVRLAIAEYLHQEIGDQFRPPQILRRLVRAGRLGKKSGHGFYNWD
jgi:3-hydroxybutyryl-CoA dehydrogenase